MASGAQSAIGNSTGIASNATFTNGLMIYVIPHSLFTVSLTTVLFTQMSQNVIAKRFDLVRENFSYGVRTTNSFTILATGIFIILSAPIARVLLPGISALDAHSVADTIVPLSLGLVPLGMTLLIKRVFYAFEDGKTVFLFQIPMSLVLIVGSILATKIFNPYGWVSGIAFFYALSFLIGVILRIGHLRKLLHGIDGKNILIMNLKSAAAIIVSMFIGLTVHDHVFTIDNVGSSIINILITMPIMVVVYLGLCYIMKTRELFDFFRLLRHKK